MAALFPVATERGTPQPLFGGGGELDVAEFFGVSSASPRSIGFYSGKLGLNVEWSALPAFAMIRIGAGTIGLLSAAEARKEGVEETSAAQRRAIHLEFRPMMSLGSGR